MVTAQRLVDFDGVHCKVTLQQPAKAVVLLKISGTDTGELGDAPMRILEEWLADSVPVDLFIDARNVRTASIDVSSEWAAWLNAHKVQLKSVTMLTGSRFIQITAEFVRRFAGLNGMMWVCTEPDVFDLAVTQAQNR
jgi:hypothetical protein